MTRRRNTSTITKTNNQFLLLILWLAALAVTNNHRNHASAIIAAGVSAQESSDGATCDSSDNDNGATKDARRSIHEQIRDWKTPPPPKSCRLFALSQSPQQERQGQRSLAIHVGTDHPRGAPLTPLGGDVVIHLIDVNSKEGSVLQKWLENGFLTEASHSGHGGNYEGLGRVMTVLPGVGMLAGFASSWDDAGNNYGGDADGVQQQHRQQQQRPNVWASVPETDEANLPRNTHPSAAGSFALHHNLTYVVTHPMGIQMGEKVLVDRWGWHRSVALGELQNNIPTTDTAAANHDVTGHATLQEKGVCIDNLHYGTSHSHGKHGRGAMASRFLPKGSIVAPVPVLPIPRKELQYLRVKEWKRVVAFRRGLSEKEKEVVGGVNNDDGHDNNEEKEIVDDDASVLPPGMKWRQQLLLNYCFGHVNSSVLLFPFGLHVNFINHAPSVDSSLEDNNGDGSDVVANVGLRWSERLMEDSDGDERKMTPEELFARPNPDGLVLEYVALRDIRPEEEILFDYGSLWSEAWDKSEKQHATFDATTTDDDYTPAYIMEDVVSNLRTAEEQLTFPYPDNVFTACFYRYEMGDDEQSRTGKSTTTQSSSTQTQTIPWEMSRGLFDMINLRPCKVIAREPASQQSPQQQQQTATGGGKMFYTAIIQNRPGLPQKERIPKGKKHIVSGIPREAIRFVDRPYTSDVHLEGAFRHNIGLEGLDIFPDIWLDLV